MDIHFLTSGAVTESARTAAESAVRKALAGTTASAVAVRGTLTLAPDPSLPRPALAQATADIDGRSLRVQAAARTIEEAITLLEDRLTIRVVSLLAG
ncbi:hypothetical protein DZF91_31065 [Actinomadura logoneensis]|uniref:Uncharacterized protein n=1 Tax=Actinomadura logoneensis TaxID=2293572 RepID=A0A372JCQ5_9ACTN|nr:hypothetical protein [Actinomadura logoneensis]RFU37793.1 hypothetical protein DZF91_31065 [Actinomadura logoneensis]